MGILFESEVMDIACISIFTFWLMFVYFVKNYDYWRIRGVPYVPAWFPLGSLPQLVFGRVHYTSAIDQAYKQFSHDRFIGIIEVRSPILIIKDPDLIKEILSKKFNQFTDRCIPDMNSKSDYLNHNLFTMKGNEWKVMRMKLTPAYTVCKMKMMFFLVKECSDQLRKAVEEKTDVCNIVEVNDIVLRFIMDVIGSCAFGIDVNTLFSRDSVFYHTTKDIMRKDVPHLLKSYLVKSFPIFHNVSLFTMIKSEVKEYITNLVHKTVAYRERNEIKRMDFLDLLIKIRQNEIILDDDEKTSITNDNFSSKTRNNKSEGMTLDQMAAETYLFFGASFESLSSVIVFCLFELSCNQSIQNHLFLEIEEILNRFDGTICFQALQEMTYLDQVINETMRIYPPFPLLNRVCTKSYKIPESDVTLEEGLVILIPVYSIHHDPKHYPEPDLFDPGRFSPENCQSRHPYVFLPFGEGPRVCIGMRYSLMMVKTAIVTLVNDYAFSLTPDTQVPPKINSRSLVLQPSQPLHLVLNHRRHKPV
ncbi:hypothetical protein J6590_086159 [Homalodisca vitripennis]|nr:hypothetical protein J6590_086159 [Homalodisca vitripennis]